MKRIRVWLVTSEHLEDRLWFREESDFITGMNYVAIQVSESQVTVLAFILMSNHVHFVLVCTRQEAELFINNLKCRYSRYLQKRYGLFNTLKRNRVDIREIPSDQESLAWTVSYVINNCVAANICSHPSFYPWGSGDACFNLNPIEGTPLSGLSARKTISLLKSKSTLPGNWLISGKGYILPRSYVKFKYLEESVFVTPWRMTFFINNSSKAKKNINSGERDLPAFRDQSILAALPDLCRSLFGEVDFLKLAEKEQVEILRQARFRFSSNVNQLARVTGLTYDAAARLLDRA